MISTGAFAVEPKKVDNSAEEKTIRATADAFIKAFNAGDAKAVAALWAAEGTVADDRGEIFQGRKAIEEQYVALFKAQPGARMEIAIQSIQFPTPSVAIEDGVATVITKVGAPPTASRYSVVHVLQDGKWLMASVRESSIETPSNYPRMQELEWLVGTWENKSADTVVRTEIRWIANKSFLQRDYSVRQGGLETSSGTQIIGWDAQTGQIRSWSFDSLGGNGTSLWRATPDGWRIESSGVQADGAPTSSHDFLVRVPGENNVLGWRSTDRQIGTVQLPDLREVVFDRVPE